MPINITNQILSQIGRELAAEPCDLPGVLEYDPVSDLYFPAGSDRGMAWPQVQAILERSRRQVIILSKIREAREEAANCASEYDLAPGRG